MAIADNKISTAEVNQYHVQGVPGDRLTGTVQENKAVFDALPELIVERHNGLTDDVKDIDDALEISSGVKNLYRSMGWIG